LEKLSESSEQQFRVIHVLSEPDDEWTGRNGRVTEELLNEFLLPVSNSKFVCICGPNGFVVKSLMCLKEMEFEDKSLYVFQG